MSNQPSWPAKPFYIISKIARSNWVLTVTDNGSVALQRLTSAIDQVWTATPSPSDGVFLRHVKSGRVLSCGLISPPMLPGFQVPGGPLKAVALDPGDAKQLWRVEDLGDNWVGINSALQWEAKINVYGSDVGGTIGLFRWDGGADNEEWRLVEEDGESTVDSVEYDLPRATTDLNLPPSHCTLTVVDNTLGATPVESTYSLARSVTTTRTITRTESNTTGDKYTQTYSVKGGVKDTFEVSASASIERSTSQTISLTDQTTDAKTVTDTISTKVSVPPGKKYSYHVVVYYGKVTVPYTAHLTFQSSTTGVAPVKLTTEGVFTGVNNTLNEIVVTDLASPDQKLVARLHA